MGKLVANFFTTLDGVVESPDQWHFPYFDDAMGAIIGAGMETQAAFLMGRQLYSEWSEYWPAHAEEDFGPYINSVPKYVVTDSLTEATWANTTLITGDDKAGQVRALKESAEGDIGMSGCATTVRWLLTEGLLDELALLVDPIAVGKGQRLFEEGVTHPLRLVHCEALPSGVLHVRYAPA